MFEILQMRQYKMDYFKDVYNIFDTSMFIIYTAYFCLRMHNPIAMLVGDMDETQRSVKVTVILMITIVFNVLILLQIVVKILFFMRVNNKFGMLVQLVLTCMHDIREFLIFMFCWIGAFTVLTIELGSDNSMTAPSVGGGYPGLLIKVQTFIQTWEDSIGNMANPTYLYWTSVIANNTAAAHAASKNPNYMIDLSDEDITAKQVFKDISTRTTDF